MYVWSGDGTCTTCHTMAVIICPGGEYVDFVEGYSMIGSHFPVEPKPPLPLLVDGSSCDKERKTLKYCIEASNVMLEHYYNGISE